MVVVVYNLCLSDDVCMPLTSIWPHLNGDVGLEEGGGYNL